MLDFMHEDIHARGIETVTLLTDNSKPAYQFYVNRDYTVHAAPATTVKIELKTLAFRR